MRHLIDAQQLAFTLKTPWRDGTCHLLLSPLELIEKLAALVPPPRLHLIRYHGVLAPNAKDRPHIVPAAPAHSASASTIRAPPNSDRPRSSGRPCSLACSTSTSPSARPAAGCMRIIAALTDPASIRSYLSGVGLPTDPPLIAPARPPPQRDLDFALIDTSAPLVPDCG